MRVFIKEGNVRSKILQKCKNKLEPIYWNWLEDSKMFYEENTLIFQYKENPIYSIQEMAKIANAIENAAKETFGVDTTVYIEQEHKVEEPAEKPEKGLKDKRIEDITLDELKELMKNMNPSESFLLLFVLPFIFGGGNSGADYWRGKCDAYKEMLEEKLDGISRQI